ncbi:F-box/kelch-repeat protein At3g23880-like [Neltuma alba]|uniref:F-box/kelch-repeat protein At3g23880-like n=1 Tax=Neltuma alba TaxID=207710 RepID=UPI0010A3C235|nr:F-box/kelch-repeat protein At3g23880-like [Prosopis alba]XP_028754806.1 F-box/kelch-repeat protein At3g23880-like [Prosopis alba]
MASGGDKPFLPLEIIINILKRLPVKSIVRFQSVCKEWKHLFKTPSFIAEHARHSAHDDPLLLLYGYDYQRRRPSLCLLNHKIETVKVVSIPSIDSFRRSWRIIGSCNGLLCVKVDHDRGRSPSLWLWHPVIKKVREIPLTSNDFWDICTYGFGFSSTVNDYKIVRFYNNESRKKKEDQRHHTIGYDRVEVYSLSTGSWKELEFEFGAIEHIGFIPQAVNADGTISWLGLGLSPLLVSFDIATEVFTLTQIPTEYGTMFGLGVYDNKLEVHYMIEEESGSHFIRVRVMEEVAIESGKTLSYTQKYTIGPVSDFLRPACIWRNEIVCRNKKIEAEVEDDPRCILYLFNLITGEGRKFNYSCDCDWCDIFTYEESLVSVWNIQVE